MSGSREDNGGSSSSSSSLEQHEEITFEEHEAMATSNTSLPHLQSNYFTIVSNDHLVEGGEEDEDNEQSSLPSSVASSEADWMEPLQPYRTCVLTTTEEDEDCPSSQRSRSDESITAEADERSLPDSFHYLLSPISASFGDPIDGACELPNNNTSMWPKWQIVQTPRTSTLCSIAVAAAVISLIIVGCRWQRLRTWNHKLRLQLYEKEQKISQLIYQIARTKESLSDGQRVPIIKASLMDLDLR